MHLDGEHKCLLDGVSGDERVSVHAAPGRYVLHRTWVSRSYAKHVAIIQIFDAVLCAYYWHRAQKPACVQAVLRHAIPV